MQWLIKRVHKVEPAFGLVDRVCVIRGTSHCYHGIRKRSDWKMMMMMTKKNNEHPKRAIACSNSCPFLEILSRYRGFRITEG